MRLTPADSLPTANRSFTFKYYGDAPAPQGTTPRDVMLKEITHLRHFFENMANNFHNTVFHSLFRNSYYFPN